MKKLGMGIGLEQGIYDRFDPEQMILRDQLAADRTSLANQTAFLAYIRTALALFAGGVTFVHFFDMVLLKVTGWVFLPLGVVTFWVGFYRYNRLRIELRKLRRR
jgi:putative membrane protein